MEDAREDAPRLGKTSKTHGKTLRAWKNIEDAIIYQKTLLIVFRLLNNSGVCVFSKRGASSRASLMFFPSAERLLVRLPCFHEVRNVFLSVFAVFRNAERLPVRLPKRRCCFP